MRTTDDVHCDHCDEDPPERLPLCHHRTVLSFELRVQKRRSQRPRILTWHKKIRLWSIRHCLETLLTLENLHSSRICQTQCRSLPTHTRRRSRTGEEAGWEMSLHWSVYRHYAGIICLGVLIHLSRRSSFNSANAYQQSLRVSWVYSRLWTFPSVKQTTGVHGKVFSRVNASIALHQSLIMR